MALTFSVAVDEREAVAALLGEAARVLNAALARAAATVRVRVGAEFRRAVESSPEYGSLHGGDLQGQLGVRDPAGVTGHVIEAVQAGIEIVVRPVAVSGGSLSGGITLSVLRKDLTEVLGVPGGVIVSSDGRQVPWLQWLLTAGDAILVEDHDFLAVRGRPLGRTGLGVMRKIVKARPGWRVPVEAAGTYADNWLSRALGTMADRVGPILAEEVEKGL